MDRRRCLALVGSCAIPGCLATPDPGQQSAEPTTSTTDNSRYRVDARTVELDASSNVSLDVSVSNSGDSEAVSTLSIVAENRGDSPYAISAGPARPFGILVASNRGTPTTRFTLWSSSYADSDHITVRGTEIVSRQKVESGFVLDPGDSVSQEYQIDTDIVGLDDASEPITSGTYLLQNADGDPFSVGGYGIEIAITA